MTVYLDFNATTPVDFDVQEEIKSVLQNNWGNPSSSYEFGKEAKRVIQNSRTAVAKMIGAFPEEIVFTSGGTESNNMVIYSVLHNYNCELAISEDVDMEHVPHIITTNIEHDSIKLPLISLAKDGKLTFTCVPVSKETGVVNAHDVISEIRPNTRLITVMLANNETGIIQPVSLIKEYLDSFKKNFKHPIFLHTDAAQAIGKVNVDVHELGVDYLTIVGHKFYGPRIGALYFKLSCPLYPIFFGGGQENKYRPGTENTCMIAGLGKASQLVQNNLHEYNKHMLTIKTYFKECLKNEFCDQVTFNFNSESVEMLPNTLSVAFNFDNVTGKMILNEALGICASTGAACHSGGKPSSILIASGVSEVLASKTLRLSVGRETSKDDIDTAVKCLKESLYKLSNKIS